jgi:flagellar biosynthesis GTPase FlhF
MEQIPENNGDAIDLKAGLDQGGNDDANAAELESAEVKAAAEKKAADEKASLEKKASDKKEAEKKPDSYELKLPEGSKLSKADADEIAAYAKEQGLSQEQAQKQLERESKLVEVGEARSLEKLKEATGQWLEAAKTDKEIGGEAFPKNAELAKRVVTRFGTAEFKAELERTGLGNHPELVRTFVRIGQAMSDDQFIMPGTQPNQQKDLATRFYGEEKKE